MPLLAREVVKRCVLRALCRRAGVLEAVRLQGSRDLLLRCCGLTRTKWTAFLQAAAFPPVSSYSFIKCTQPCLLFVFLYIVLVGDW